MKQVKREKIGQIGIGGEKRPPASAKRNLATEVVKEVNRIENAEGDQKPYIKCRENKGGVNLQSGEVRSIAAKRRTKGGGEQTKLLVGVASW